MNNDHSDEQMTLSEETVDLRVVRVKRYQNCLDIRLANDSAEYGFGIKTRWRITPLNHECFAIYRAGRRMWTKPTLHEALAYVKKNIGHISVHVAFAPID